MNIETKSIYKLEVYAYKMIYILMILLYDSNVYDWTISS